MSVSLPDGGVDPWTAEAVRSAAVRARAAAAALAPAPRIARDAALEAMAEALLAAEEAVLAANAVDVERARGAGETEALVDRLALTPARLAGMAAGLRAVAALPDPVGEVVRGGVLPNGLSVQQVRVPLGVVGIVYEARPNVTADAAGLCLKSGNAVLLRGSSSAAASNRAIVEVLSEAVAKAGLPADAVQLLAGEGRDSVTALLRARGLVDVVIPRGGAGLIASVVANATVPVIETGVGNCHIYLDASADPAMAEAIVLDAKTTRPSVCNAVETVLIHAAAAPALLARLLPALAGAGVVVHGDAAVLAHPAARGLTPAPLPATDDDWAAEYGSLDLAVGVVDSLDDAVTHIRRWGSGHTEAIVTRDLAASRRFVAHLDSAAVMVNASTRFTDGGELGFGAEIGISTQKLHARGPMGLTELTTTTLVVTGDGHVRG